jgi:hypothetical protein
MLQMLMQQQSPPQGLTLNSAPMQAPVTPVAGGLPDWSGAYGASPVVGMGGGMPLSGTAQKADINMQQAKMLQQALKALRTSGLGK